MFLTQGFIILTDTGAEKVYLNIKFDIKFGHVQSLAKPGFRSNADFFLWLNKIPEIEILNICAFRCSSPSVILSVIGYIALIVSASKYKA